MEDSEVYRLLSEDLKVSYSDLKCCIIYVAADGKKFTDKLEFMKYDMIVSRQIYYDFLMSKRNWIERFFNIKPSMKFYDNQPSPY